MHALSRLSAVFLVLGALVPIRVSGATPTVALESAGESIEIVRKVLDGVGDQLKQFKDIEVAVPAESDFIASMLVTSVGGSRSGYQVVTLMVAESAEPKVVPRHKSYRGGFRWRSFQGQVDDTLCSEIARTMRHALIGDKRGSFLPAGERPASRP